jgi:DNA invertase Pin-like site-specific DNA recombinase
MRWPIRVCPVAVAERDRTTQDAAVCPVLFCIILAAFAEFERDLIRERTRDGLAATTARGRNGGRKRRLTPGQVQAARDLRAAGRSVGEIGQLLGNGKPVSRQTVFRALGMLAT